MFTEHSPPFSVHGLLRGALSHGESRSNFHFEIVLWLVPRIDWSYSVSVEMWRLVRGPFQYPKDSRNGHEKKQMVGKYLVLERTFRGFLVSDPIGNDLGNSYSCTYNKKQF